MSKTTASHWVEHYKEEGGKWDRLSRQLDPKKETTCILYSASSLLEFIKELDCFIKDESGSIVSIYFGAYLDGQLIAYLDANGVRQTYDAGNQLCLFFTVKDKQKLSIVIHSFRGITDYDTGTPCPPETNCVGSSL